MPWSTKQILNPARKVAGVEDFSAYHGKHRGSLTDYSFALHFVLLLPLPEMHPRVFTGSGLSPKSFQPIPAGLCHSLLSSASTIFRLHFPGPSKPLSQPRTGDEHQVDYKTISFVDRKFFAGREQQKKERTPLNCELAGNPRRARI